jgi:hypothetical protein
MRWISEAKWQLQKYSKKQNRAELKNVPSKLGLIPVFNFI